MKKLLTIAVTVLVSIASLSLVVGGSPLPQTTETREDADGVWERSGAASWILIEPSEAYETKRTAERVVEGDRELQQRQAELDRQRDLARPVVDALADTLSLDLRNGDQALVDALVCFKTEDLGC